MGIQRSEFHDGSFVLHKVMINGQKYSAWYSQDGTLKDCERVIVERTCNVPSNHVSVRAELDRIGRLHAARR